MWSVADSIELARKYVIGMGDRWVHLSTAGGVTEDLAARFDLVTDSVVSAAWLHDIGYSSALASTGFHPLDGARFLQSVGCPEEIVALVGHHTGAAQEASERGLCDVWERLPVPNGSELDVLTMVDLAVGPTGELQLDLVRIAEMLTRYDKDHPVHEAVTKSRNELLASSARGKRSLGLADHWPLVASQSVRDAESHGGVQI